jgi:hypothetical protein
MGKINEEQKIIVDEILYQKKNPIKTFTSSFNQRCRDRKNIHINVHYTKYVTTCYIKVMIDVDPLKLKVMKLTYIEKITFNINGIIIFLALRIPLNKKK